MNYKFKIGDKVIMHKFAHPTEGINWNSSMERHNNQEGIIIGLYQEGSSKGYYVEEWIWPESSLTPANPISDDSNYDIY